MICRYTVLFAVARTVGWVAQWKEMAEEPISKISRPRQVQAMGSMLVPSGMLAPSGMLHTSGQLGAEQHLVTILLKHCHCRKHTVSEDRL